MVNSVELGFVITTYSHFSLSLSLSSLLFSLLIAHRKTFVWDNFAFYSILLIEFLSRCYHLDLKSENHIMLLYRTAKVCNMVILSALGFWLVLVQVFSQSDLVSFIENGESLLLNQDAGPQMSPGTRGSPKPAVSSIKATLVNCDGPMFQYTPIFDQNVLQLVSKRHTCTQSRAEQSRAERERKRERERERCETSHNVNTCRCRYYGRKYIMQRWLFPSSWLLQQGGEVALCSHHPLPLSPSPLPPPLSVLLYPAEHQQPSTSLSCRSNGEL